MNRREYLAAAGAVSTATALAGCSGNVVEAEEHFELVDHNFFSGSLNGPEFEVTLENISDEYQQNITILAEFYEGNTIFYDRLDLGIESTKRENLFGIRDPDQVERYVLKNDSNDGDAVKLEEHSGNHFREKLAESE